MPCACNNYKFNSALYKKPVVVKRNKNAKNAKNVQKKCPCNGKQTDKHGVCHCCDDKNKMKNNGGNRNTQRAKKIIKPISTNKQILLSSKIPNKTTTKPSTNCALYRNNHTKK